MIVDWNSTPTNHGKKVASVARATLSKLGLTEFGVTEVDLNPANNRATLTDIFEDFVQHDYCSSQGCEGSKGIVEESRSWLRTNPRATSANTIPVKQLVLEAVLWRYFKKQPSWVNMSFSVASPALEILQAAFFSNPHSFGFSAANDAGFPESSAGIPQRAATLYSNFVNVTYANADGTLIGGYSNQLANMIVSVVAPGCGFDYGSIKPSDAGTSYASPYVAVAAWIKFLLDKVGPSDMRKQLISASLLSATPSGLEVESGGLFDLPTLLLPQGYVLFAADGTLIPIRNGTMTISYKTPAVTGRHLEATVPIQAGEGVSVSLFLRTGALFARVRRFRPGNPMPPLTDTYEWEVTRLALTATDSNGTSITANETNFPAKYVRLIF